MAFTVEAGPERGRVITLPVGRGTIGNDPRHAHLVLRDPSVAPGHLAVDKQPDGRVTVWPVGGPAWIDGAPIQGAAPVPPGARVHIGQTTLRFDAVQPAAAAPAPPPAPGSRKPSKGLIAAYVVMGLIAKWLLGSVFANHGAQAGVIVLAAVVPAPLLVALVLLIDRYEPEPRRVLAITYLYGATAAVALAGFFNAFFAVVLGVAGNPFAELSVVVPIVEETVKCLAVLAVFRHLRHEFNGVIDAVVYSAMVGLGFAVTENMLYYGDALMAGGDALALTFVMRGVLSPFAHPLFTSMFGIGLALASETARARPLWPALGWLVGVFLHGLWNAAASIGLGFLVVYVVFFVPVFALLVVGVFLASRREQRLIRTHLAQDVESGLLTPDELDKLASIRRRRTAERESAQAGGDAAKDLRRGFHAAATRLAFLRHRREVGALYAPSAEDEARQVERLQQAKAAALAWVR